MTVRTDITVDWLTSPRIITVASPSTELLLQDLVDTCRVLEDDLSPGMSQPRLIDAAGKEDLGGGTQVGITAKLNNAQVRFQARTTPVETGTHTGSGNSANLIDAAADFTMAAVARGSIVINCTDGSISQVKDLVSSTELSFLPPGPFGGTDNDFDASDAYTVWNVTEVAIRAGNLTAVDDMDVAIEALLPSFGTKPTVELSTSAALVNAAVLALKIDELHNIHGLDSTEPLLITDTARTTGAITQTVLDDGTTTTVTRT